MKPLTDLGERLDMALKALQEKRPFERINKAWLGRKVGISSPGISKWFHDDIEITAVRLLKAATVLEVNPYWLLKGGQLDNLGGFTEQQVYVIEACDSLCIGVGLLSYSELLQLNKRMLGRIVEIDPQWVQLKKGIIDAAGKQ